MFRNSSRRNITPFLHELLNPSPIPQGSGAGGEGSGLSICEFKRRSHRAAVEAEERETRGDWGSSNYSEDVNQVHHGRRGDSRRHQQQQQQQNMATTRGSFVLRNLKDASFFSTRGAAKVTAATNKPASNSGGESEQQQQQQQPNGQAILSDTLRRLDKAVRRAVDLERCLTAERLRCSSSSSADADKQGQQQAQSSTPAAAAAATDGAAEGSFGGSGGGREDLIIAKMLLGESESSGYDLGAEQQQIAALAATGHGNGGNSTDLLASSASVNTINNKTVDRYERALAAALDDVRMGIRDIGLLSTLGIAKVFEAIISKGQAVTGLAILSKWLHDSHFGANGIGDDGGGGAANLVAAKPQTLLFPFGDSANTGVQSAMEGSAFVSGLPGRALMMAALVAASSYDREAYLAFSSYKKKRIDEHLANRAAAFSEEQQQQQNNRGRGGRFESRGRGRINNSSTMNDSRRGHSNVHEGRRREGVAESTAQPIGVAHAPSKWSRDETTHSHKKSNTNADEGAEEDDGMIENDGDLYVTELCRRWICNPMAVLHYRREAVAAAAAAATGAERAQTEAAILEMISQRLSLQQFHGSSNGGGGGGEDPLSSFSIFNSVTEATAQGNVGAVDVLSEADEVILMILLTMGALNCRGSLPLIQKRFASLSSYSDRLQQLAEKVLRVHGSSSRSASASPFGDDDGFLTRAVAGDRVAEIAKALRQLDEVSSNSSNSTAQQSSLAASFSQRQRGGRGRGGRGNAAAPSNSNPNSSNGIAPPPLATAAETTASDGPFPPSPSPYHGVLSAAEQQTIHTIDHLQGRLASEVEGLRAYAIRLIMKVFDGLESPQNRERRSSSGDVGGSPHPHPHPPSKRRHVDRRVRAERVVAEVLGCILHSCDGEGPMAMSAAMSSHRLFGAYTPQQHGNQQQEGAGGKGSTTAAEDPDADLVTPNHKTNGSGAGSTTTPATKSYTQLLKERRAAKALQQAQRRTHQEDWRLTYDFIKLSQSGVPMRPTPSPSASSTAALGLLFPHKAWRAILNMPVLAEARRNDVAAAELYNKVGELPQQHHHDKGGVDEGASLLSLGGLGQQQQQHTSIEDMLKRLEDGGGGSADPSTPPSSTQATSAPAVVTTTTTTTLQRPTISVYSEQLFLCAMDSIEGALGVVLCPLSAPSAAMNPSLRTNIYKMGELLHSNHNGNHNDGGSGEGDVGGVGSSTDVSGEDPLLPPSLRSEREERLDVLIRGIMSKVEPEQQQQQQQSPSPSPLASSYSRRPPFAARGTSDKDAVLTSFPLQSQLVQHTLRSPTTLQDKRHYALYQTLGLEAMSPHDTAASGVHSGLGSGQESHELFVWQRPKVIYGELVAMWRQCVGIAKGQYTFPSSSTSSAASAMLTGGATDNYHLLEDHHHGMDDGDSSSHLSWAGGQHMSAAINFHLLRRWVQLAALFGDADDGGELMQMLRVDVSGERADFRNFRHFIGKLMLSAMGAHPNAPALFDAHIPPMGALRERFGDQNGGASGGADLGTIAVLNRSSPSPGAAAAASHHQQQLAFSTTFFTGPNGITIIGREPTRVASPNSSSTADGGGGGSNHHTRCVNPYACDAAASSPSTTSAASANGDSSDTSSSSPKSALLASLTDAGRNASTLLGGDGSADQQQQQRLNHWEGIGYVDKTVALPSILGGYLWADPLVSMLGNGGVRLPTLPEEGGSSSNDGQSSDHPLSLLSTALASDPRSVKALIEGMPAQWWQFVVANNLWELTVPRGTADGYGAADVEDSSSSSSFTPHVRNPSANRAICSILRLIHVGTAVHGRSLLHRAAATPAAAERNTEQKQQQQQHHVLQQWALLQHYVGDGKGTASRFTSSANSSSPSTSPADEGGLVPSSAANALEPLPSLRVLYKLMLCSMASLPCAVGTHRLDDRRSIGDTCIVGGVQRAGSAADDDAPQVSSSSPYSTTSTNGEEEEAGGYLQSDYHHSERHQHTANEWGEEAEEQVRMGAQEDDQPMAFEDDGASSAFDDGDEASMLRAEMLAQQKQQRLKQMGSSTNSSTSSRRNADDGLNGADQSQSPEESLASPTDANNLSSSPFSFIHDIVLPEGSPAHLYQLLVTAPMRWANLMPRDKTRDGLLPLSFDASGVVALLLPQSAQLMVSPPFGDAPLVPTISSVLCQNMNNKGTGIIGASNSPAPNLKTAAAAAVHQWARSVSTALRQCADGPSSAGEGGVGGYASLSNSPSLAAVSGYYSPFREMKTQLMATFAASNDPLMCLMVWVFAGSRPMAVSPISGAMPISPLTQSESAVNMTTVRVLLDPQQSGMHPKTIIAVSRMLLSMGYSHSYSSPHLSSTPSRLGQLESNGLIGVSIPMCATSGSSSSSLQALWTSAVCPAAMDGLVHAMVASPGTLNSLMDLTFGTYHANTHAHQDGRRQVGAALGPSSAVPKLASIPHEAVRAVFRGVLLLHHSAAAERDSWLQQQPDSHLITSALPSLQNAVAASGVRQPLMPNLRSLGVGLGSGGGRKGAVVGANNTSAGSGGANHLPEASTRVVLRSGLVDRSSSSSREARTALEDLF